MRLLQVEFDVLNGDAQASLVRKVEVAIASAFLAFLFAWHFRADFIEIGRTAASLSTSLALECR